MRFSRLTQLWIIGGLTSLLGGCACSTPAGEVDASGDTGRSMDARVADVTLDAANPDIALLPDAFVPPIDASRLDAPGMCSPPAPWNRDRFDGDTQEARDAEHVFEALLRCALVKGCGEARILVDETRLVTDILTTSDGILECVQTELLGLCIPTRAGEERDEIACYI